MIAVRLHIGNPWRREDFYSYYCWSGDLPFKHKHWEIQAYRYSWDLLHFNLDTKCLGEDHAGPELEFGLLGFSIRFKIYDSRHWDYDKNDWVDYEHYKVDA